MSVRRSASGETSSFIERSFACRNASIGLPPACGTVGLASGRSDHHREASAEVARVVLCALFDPAFEHGDLFRTERRSGLRHPRIRSGYYRQQQAFVRMSGRDDSANVVPPASRPA